MKKSDLEELHQKQEYPAVSIVIPTHRTIPEKLQDRIRVKNALTKARELLLKEFEERDVTSVLKNLDDLTERIDYTDTLDGLALFASPDTAQVYRLPFPVQERVIIDDTFETRDLVLTLNRTPQYWVLALSEKFTRLFHGIGDTLIEMIGPTVDQYGEPTSGFPLNDLGPNDTQKFSVGTGDRDAWYLDDHMKQFFRFVDDFFYEHYLKNDPLPVFLASAETNLSMYKEITKHPEAYVMTIEGNFEPDEYSPGQLAKKVWPVVQEYLAQEREQVLKELDSAIGTQHYAFSFEPVWRAAVEGRVHKLLVERDFSKAGIPDPNNPVNVIYYDDPKAPGVSDDLVDNLIEMVQQKGDGRVIFYEPGTLEDYDHIVAILRY